MDINNVTQYYNLLEQTGLTQQAHQGHAIKVCLNEYGYQCNCVSKTGKDATYARCNALYEESVGAINAAMISLLFQKVSDISISFRKENRGLLRTIHR